MQTRQPAVPSASCWTVATTLLALGSLLGVGVAPANAQGPNPRLGIEVEHAFTPMQQAKPNPKDEGTATILSLVIIGAGQMYAGDTNRGLMMLGGAYGALIVGAVVSASGCDYGSCNATPLAIGAIAWLGIGIYSIIDAAPTVRRMNKQRGLAEHRVVPQGFIGRDGEVGLGLRLAF